MQKTNRWNNEWIDGEIDVFDIYGKDAFFEYLKENLFEIQTKKTLKNGKERRYNYKGLTTFWQEIITMLIRSKDINLAQIVCNYHNPIIVKAFKQDIIHKLLQKIRMKWMTIDIYGEASLLGLGLLFDDLLEDNNADSLVHVYNGKMAKNSDNYLWNIVWISFSFGFVTWV